MYDSRMVYMPILPIAIERNEPVANFHTFTCMAYYIIFLLTTPTTLVETAVQPPNMVTHNNIQYEF